METVLNTVFNLSLIELINFSKNYCGEMADILSLKNQQNSLKIFEVKLLLLNSNLDYNTFKKVLISPFFEWNIKSLSSLYLVYYIESYYYFLVAYNIWFRYVAVTYYETILGFNMMSINIFSRIFKWSCYVYVFMTILCYQSKTLNLKITMTTMLNKLFMLNESEKELGSLDDSISFFFVFFITIFGFIIFLNLILITKTISFMWFFSGLIITLIFIILIPLNVFFDMGSNFVAYIKGSSASSNMFIEGFFDVIACSIVIARFIVQNIRFVFIFGAIFELFEWTFCTNSIILMNQFTHIENINTIGLDYFIEHNLNIILINILLTIIFYFYYILHLIFLLIVQLSIYILISLWLFFFLYTTFFLNKTEKFFLYKRYI